MGTWDIARACVCMLLVAVAWWSVQSHVADPATCCVPRPAYPDHIHTHMHTHTIMTKYRRCLSHYIVSSDNCVQLSYLSSQYASTGSELYISLNNSRHPQVCEASAWLQARTWGEDHVCRCRMVVSFAKNDVHVNVPINWHWGTAGFLLTVLQLHWTTAECAAWTRNYVIFVSGQQCTVRRSKSMSEHRADRLWDDFNHFWEATSVFNLPLLHHVTTLSHNSLLEEYSTTSLPYCTYSIITQTLRRIHNVHASPPYCTYSIITQTIRWIQIDVESCPADRVAMLCCSSPTACHPAAGTNCSVPVADYWTSPVSIELLQQRLVRTSR